MRITDMWLMILGWSDEREFYSGINRKMTELLGEITNRTFGGSGVLSAIRNAWPLSTDPKPEPIDMDKVKRTLKAYREHQRKKRNGS